MKKSEALELKREVISWAKKNGSPLCSKIPKKTADIKVKRSN